MIHRVDAALVDEAARYKLVFWCGRCVHHEPEKGGCALGYPTAPHAREDLVDRDEILFCKTFELF